MKRIGVIATATLAAFVGSSSPVPAQQPTTRPTPPATTVHRVHASTPDERGWYPAKSTDGHFSVSTPTPFDDITTQSKGSSGREIVTFSIWARNTGNVLFGAVEVPKQYWAPGLNPKDLLLKGAKSDKTNTVTADREFEWHGYPAAECRVTNSRKSVLFRVIICPSTAVMLLAECPPDSVASISPTIATFVESLQIEDKP